MKNKEIIDETLNKGFEIFVQFSCFGEGSK